MTGGWQPMAVDQQQIKVKGEGTVALRLRSTPHGPLLSDAIGRINEGKSVSSLFEV